MLTPIDQAAEYLRQHLLAPPEVGIILGTGLGGLADHIVNPSAIAYGEIPGFPVSTVEGHKGVLYSGTLGGKRIIAMQGRFHYYEGYQMSQVTFPVRVMQRLGVKLLFVSNASGGLNPSFQIGDLMLITDHINLLPNPLIGPNDDAFGPRFPDMSQAYNRSCIQLAHRVAGQMGIKLQEGVYVGTTGPTFETPAEYRFFRTIGGDAVGMSTVPEVIIAHHAGLPVFAISIITDLGVEGKIVEVSHEDVQKAGARAEKTMTELLQQMLQALDLGQL